MAAACRVVFEADAGRARGVTAFVLDTVTARAHEVLERQGDLVLSNAEFDGVIAELGKLVWAVDELVGLFVAHRELPEV